VQGHSLNTPLVLRAPASIPHNPLPETIYFRRFWAVLGQNKHFRRNNYWAKTIIGPKQLILRSGLCAILVWFQRLKLQYDEPLSNFAFNFNLRRYIKVVPGPAEVANSEFFVNDTQGRAGQMSLLPAMSSTPGRYCFCPPCPRHLADTAIALHVIDTHLYYCPPCHQHAL